MVCSLTRLVLVMLCILWRRKISEYDQINYSLDHLQHLSLHVCGHAGKSNLSDCTFIIPLISLYVHSCFFTHSSPSRAVTWPPQAENLCVMVAERCAKKPSFHCWSIYFIFFKKCLCFIHALTTVLSQFISFKLFISLTPKGTRSDTHLP